MFESELVSTVGLTPIEVRSVASAVAAEVSTLDESAKQRIRAADAIPVSARLEELRAFQAFMDWAGSQRNAPVVTRAQVIVQNYVCFVYLRDACFEMLARELSAASVAARCCRFLLADRLRWFRNAVAHSNWQYTSDFGGIRFLARQQGRTAPLADMVVSQGELNFWQAMARAVAYAAFERL